MLDLHLKKMKCFYRAHSSIEVDFKSFKTIDLNSQSKFLEVVTLSEVEGSILPNWEPTQDFSQEEGTMNQSNYNNNTKNANSLIY